MLNVQGRVQRRVLHIVIVSALSFVVFINTFQNEFTYDDFPTILENRSVTEGDIREVLRSGRAIRQLSFMIDYRLFGRNPFGYHVENALIHSLNSVLVYELIILLPPMAPAAFPSALLFAVHPIHVEAVAGIANRKDLLALLFVLLSVISYINGCRTGTGGKRFALLTLSLLSYIAGSFAKQTAAVLPFILIIYDCLFLERRERLIGRAAVPVILVGLYSLYTVAEPIFSAFFARGDASFAAYKSLLLTSISVFPLDIRYLLFPFQLSADHTVDIVRDVWDPRFTVSLSILFLYMLITAIYLIRDKTVSFMLMWVLIFLLPSANLIPMSSYFFAERYLYLPSVGYSVLLGRLLVTTAARRPSGGAILLALILASFTYLTVMRNMDWKDEGTLWADTIEKSPGSVFAHNNLANVYYMKEDIAGAEREYKKALEIFPEHPEALYNLGNIYYMRGERGKALERYRAFLKVWRGAEKVRMEVIEKVKEVEKGK